MQYRIMNRDDRPKIEKLWGTVFGDSPEFVNSCIDILAGRENVFVADDDGCLAAQLLAVPCKAGGQSAVYFYALATDEKYRKAGVMTALMTTAEKAAAQNGAKLAVLVPANEGLFAYYEKRGYSKAASIRKIGVELSSDRSGGVTYTKVTPKAVNSLRQSFADVNCVMFTENQMSLLLDDVQQSGGEIAQNKNGYAVISKNGAQLLVQELFCKTLADAKTIVQAALAHTSCIAAELTMPAKSRMLAGKGEIIPFGMAKPLASTVLPEPLYIRFAGG